MAHHLAFPRSVEPTVADLPTYLGFGLLDQGSVRFEEGCLTATYSDEHHLVYEVRWNHNGCLLKSHWRGREVGRSGGPDLQKAFFYSWHGAESSWEDQRFTDVSNEIMRAGNVYFVFPRPEHVFFPAGLVFALRQPLPRSRLPAWEALKRVLESEATPGPRPSVYREGPGSILHLLAGGDTWSEPVLVVDLVVPLARVVQTVVWCVQGGIVPGGKHHRLVVSIDGGACWQNGDAEQHESAFAVLYDDEVESALAAATNPRPRAASVSRSAEGGEL